MILKEVHDKAEQTELSQQLITGDISEQEYSNFISNMGLVYNAIESRGLIQHSDLLRSDKFLIDSSMMRMQPEFVQSVWDYIDYIETLPEDKLWSHIYVHYLGDLYGGTVIKKVLPYSCAYLDFEDNAECIKYLRANAKMDSAQATICFEWVIKIYNELYELSRTANL